VILIHGEFGSGKSAALRALEAAPPAGMRAAYVPVPTLDIEGLARWCLDRLQIAPGVDAIAALRESARRERLALLIDDADRLPLETALAVRQLERDAGGNLTLVSACAAEERGQPAIVALGPPAREVAVARGEGMQATAQLRSALEPRFVRAPAAGPVRPASHQAAIASSGLPHQIVAPPPARRPAPPTAAAKVAAESTPRIVVAPVVRSRSEPAAGPQPTQPPASPAEASAGSASAPHVVVAPKPRSAGEPAADTSRGRLVAPLPASAAVTSPLAEGHSPAAAQPRMIPLSVAFIMAGAAFLVPIAFAAGYLLGTQPKPSAAADASLPAVSSSPPSDAPSPVPATGSSAAAGEVRPRRQASVAESPTRNPWARPLPSTRRAQPAEAEDREPADPPEDEGWGPAPSLLSVEPGDAGP
jgi:hypothetical protein